MFMINITNVILTLLFQIFACQAEHTVPSATALRNYPVWFGDRSYDNAPAQFAMRFLGIYLACSLEKCISGCG